MNTMSSRENPSPGSSEQLPMSMLPMPSSDYEPISIFLDDGPYTDPLYESRVLAAQASENLRVMRERTLGSVVLPQVDHDVSTGLFEKQVGERIALERAYMKERLESINGQEILDSLGSGDITGHENNIALVLSALPEREAEFLMLKYGLVDGQRHTVKDIGHMRYLTPSKVKKIQDTAINRIVSGRYFDDPS